MYIPAIFAVLALIVVGCLLLMGKNFDQKSVAYISKLGLGSTSAERVFSTLKGFILILSLAVILGAILFYF